MVTISMTSIKTFFIIAESAAAIGAIGAIGGGGGIHVPPHGGYCKCNVIIQFNPSLSERIYQSIYRSFPLVQVINL